VTVTVGVGVGVAGVRPDTGPLPGPAALVRTDAGRAAVQGTSPQSSAGRAEPPEKGERQ
jgi:hypothetical protein